MVSNLAHRVHNQCFTRDQHPDVRDTCQGAGTQVLAP